MSKPEIDKFVEDMTAQRKKDMDQPATVGDVKSSEAKMMTATYKHLEIFKNDISRNEKELADTLLGEVRIISEVLEGYFTQANENINRTNASLERIEKQIKEHGSEHVKIRNDFKAIKAQVESLGIIKH